MRERTVAVVAFAVLAVVFVFDALTPQTLIIAILLDVPIVLAALTRDRRLTAWLIGSALTANVAAALIDAARDGYHWQAIGVADRALSMLSIVLVGYLSTTVQERAERVGRLAAQEVRARREAALGEAAKRIRSSLSRDLVLRAIVREAPRALGADAATWFPLGSAGETLRARAGDDAVEVVDEPVAPEVLSLAHRASESGTPLAVGSGDALARFVLDRLDASSALAIPSADRGASGVLFVTSRDASLDDAALAAARAYGRVATDALAQARLFDELAERNAALGERQAVIRDLVNAIAHDVRTPLAALAMTLRQAKDGAYGPLPESYAKVLNDSLSSIDDLQRLAESLLAVARFEARDRPSERDAVDLAALVREVGSEMGAMAAARRVAIRVDARPARTRGSRADLRRALINLAANALQHTPEGGALELAAHSSGGVAEVEVADDGYGVDPALRSALFRRLGDRGQAGSGAGLGLYLVRRVAEDAGGSIEYAPRAPRGSVFTLKLPEM